MSYTYFTPIMLANSQSDKFVIYTYLYFLVVETWAMFMENSVELNFYFTFPILVILLQMSKVHSIPCNLLFILYYLML